MEGTKRKPKKKSTAPLDEILSPSKRNRAASGSSPGTSSAVPQGLLDQSSSSTPAIPTGEDETSSTDKAILLGAKPKSKSIVSRLTKVITSPSKKEKPPAKGSATSPERVAPDQHKESSVQTSEKMGDQEFKDPKITTDIVDANIVSASHINVKLQHLVDQMVGAAGKVLKTVKPEPPNPLDMCKAAAEADIANKKLEIAEYNPFVDVDLSTPEPQTPSLSTESISLHSSMEFEGAGAEQGTSGGASAEQGTSGGASAEQGTSGGASAEQGTSGGAGAAQGDSMDNDSKN